MFTNCMRKPFTLPVLYDLSLSVMGVFRIGFKHGFGLPSRGEHPLLNPDPPAWRLGALLWTQHQRLLGAGGARMGHQALILPLRTMVGRA